MSPVYTHEMQAKLARAAEPLQRFLRKYHNPHVTAFVDGNTVELAEGLVRVVTNATPVVEWPIPGESGSGGSADGG